MACPDVADLLLSKVRILMTPDEPQTHGWRITRIETRLQRLEDQELHATLNSVKEKVDDLHDDLVWLKRTLAGAIFTLLGGMVLFLVSIAAGWLG